MDRRKRTARTVALMSLFSMTDTQENVPVASFDGDGSDLISLIVGIEPIQDLHGYDSPWPAGGGKNVLDASTVTGSNATVTVSSDGKRIDVVATRGSYNCASFDATSLVGKGDFYLSFYAERTAGSQNNASCNGIYKLNGSYKYDGISGTRTYVNDKRQATDLVVNFPEGATNAEIQFFINNYPTVPTGGISGYFEDVRICKEQAQPWTPYSNICPISGWTGANIHVSPTTDAEDGETYSITFPTSAGTVYGGMLDVTTGKLTVDRKFITLLPTMSWQYSALTQRFFVVIGDAAARAGDHVTFGGKCNMFKAGQIGENNAVSYVNATSPGFAIMYQAVNGDMAAWKQFLSDNTVSVVYPLATPIEVDLTPTQVTTLIGTNNIWADTGDIKYIEYNI